MRMLFRKYFALAVSIGFVQTGVLLAAPFDAQFKIDRITGECTVKAPGAGDFSAAEGGKAYGYGTEIKTGADSSAVVVLSEGNEFQIMKSSQVVVVEDSLNKKLKRIDLKEGRVDVSLEKEFRKDNELEVLTPTGVAVPQGSKISVLARSQPDKKAGVFGCTEGRMDVRSSPYFSVEGMDAGDQLMVACALDRSYIMLRDQAGEFEVEVKGADASPRRVKVKPPMTIKLYMKKTDAGDKTVITTVVEGVEGKPEGESWVCEVAGGLVVADAGKPKVDEAKPTEVAPKPSADAGEKESAGLQPSEMPTTTTTTTTIPSPTPVGER